MLEMISSLQNMPGACSEMSKMNQIGHERMQ